MATPLPEAQGAVTHTPPGSIAYGDPDGHGRYGILEEDVDGLKCHECEWVGIHLGLHSAKSHDMPAREYRIKHGLRRSKGLVASPTRKKLQDRAALWYTADGPLAASRDPISASAARMAAAQPASAGRSRRPRCPIHQSAPLLTHWAGDRLRRMSGQLLRSLRSGSKTLLLDVVLKQAQPGNAQSRHPPGKPGLKSAARAADQVCSITQTSSTSPCRRENREETRHRSPGPEGPGTASHRDAQRS